MTSAVALPATRVAMIVSLPISGTSTEAVRMIDSITRSVMTPPVNRLSPRPLTRGPISASSLHSSNKNTVALGNSTRARVERRWSNPQIDALVLDETRADALVDDIALLEEQLPGRHRRVDDRNDQQYHLVQAAVRGQLRREEIGGHLPDRGMNHQEHRDEQRTAQDEDQRKALETAETAGGRGDHDHPRGDERAPQLR